MDKLWKQIVLAVTLGILVPQMVFAVGEWFTPDEVAVQETLPNEQIQTQPVQTEIIETVLAVMYLPVLMKDGSVQIMELEEYVRGVVLAEMPASFEPEALKAQAIAARTYVLRRLTLGSKHNQGVICTESTCCQAYLADGAYLESRGTRSEWEKVADAVVDTVGLVLTYEGKLIESTYFACSGGRTEDALAVWGEEIPYLRSVESTGETKSTVYDENLYFTASEFAAALGRHLSGSPDEWFGETVYTAGGGVGTMIIGGMVYSGTKLRALLDLNSTLFTVTADQYGIGIETKGWGHRVGMSQYGADAMALSGSDYAQILAYYYPGTEIDKISNVK